MRRSFALLILLPLISLSVSGVPAQACDLGQFLDNPYSQDPFAIIEYDGLLYEGGWYHMRRQENGTWGDFGGGLGGSTVVVNALMEYNGDLIIAGEFSSAGGQGVANICRWDGVSLSPIGSGLGGSFGEVNSLVEFNGQLVAGGSFTLSGDRVVNGVAAWTGTEWQAFGRGFSDVPPGFTCEVHDLCVHNGELIATGRFFHADGDTDVHSLARWDGAAWQPFGTGLYSAGAEGLGIGFALESFQGELFVSGWFEEIDGNAIDWMARWDGANWSTTGPGPTRHCLDLKTYAGELYAAGPRPFAIGGDDYSMASWDGETWHGAVWVDVNWINGMGLAEDASSLYFCGNFAHCNGVFTGNLAEWTCGVSSVTPAAPRVAVLHPAFPNPFNPNTTLSFQLEHTAHVELAVFDIAGRHISTLVDGVLVAGLHELQWGGDNKSGQIQPSGVYFVQLKHPAGIESQRLVLAK